MNKIILIGTILAFSFFASVSTGAADTVSAEFLERVRDRAKTACTPYRGKKLTLVIPVKAGGGFDLMGRALVPYLATYSGMSVSISNVVGNSGMLAMKAVADASEARLTIGLITLASFSSQILAENPLLLMSRLTAIGEISDEQSIWASRQPIDLLQAEKRMLSGAGLSAPYMRIGIPARLLDLNLKPIFGYDGSSQAWTALLRGDIDILSMSDYTMKRYLETGTTAAVSLVLSDRPHPDFPNVPHLAGQGGLVDMKTRSIDPGERLKLLSQADLVVSLSELGRILVTSSRLNPETQSCLEAASEAALFDPNLQKVALEQKFGLNPTGAKKAKDKMQRLTLMLRDNLDYLQSFATSWKEER